MKIRGIVRAGGRGGSGLHWTPGKGFVSSNTDGKGCGMCGAYDNGGHGGGCPDSDKTYDESGNLVLFPLVVNLIDNVKNPSCCLRFSS